MYKQTVERAETLRYIGSQMLSVQVPGGQFGVANNDLGYPSGGQIIVHVASWVDAANNPIKAFDDVYDGPPRTLGYTEPNGKQISWRYHPVKGRTGNGVPGARVRARLLLGNPAVGYHEADRAEATTSASGNAVFSFEAGGRVEEAVIAISVLKNPTNPWATVSLRSGGDAAFPPGPNGRRHTKFGPVPSFGGTRVAGQPEDSGKGPRYSGQRGGTVPAHCQVDERSRLSVRAMWQAAAPKRSRDGCLAMDRIALLPKEVGCQQASRHHSEDHDTQQASDQSQQRDPVHNPGPRLLRGQPCHWLRLRSLLDEAGCGGADGVALRPGNRRVRGRRVGVDGRLLRPLSLSGRARDAGRQSHGTRGVLYRRADGVRRRCRGRCCRGGTGADTAWERPPDTGRGGERPRDPRRWVRGAPCEHAASPDPVR